MSSGWWPSFSLPSSLQSRFLSFSLRRVLGHLLLPGQLDVDQINAQIGSGYVQVSSLLIDPAPVNAFISSARLPLQLVDGSLKSVTANIPWPNPLTSTIGLAVDGVHLSFHIVKPQPPDLSASTTIPLAESVASLSDSFVHEELSTTEEAQLVNSLLHPDTTTTELEHALDPFLNDPSTLEDIDPAGIPIFTSLVERLLGRFQFDASSIRVSVEIPNQVRFVLAIGQITYRDVSEGADATFSKQRQVSVQDIKILCVDLLRSSPPETPVPQPYSGETSEDELDEHTEMLMSQSLAFLPPKPTSSVIDHPARSTAAPPSANLCTTAEDPSDDDDDDDDSSSVGGSLYQSALAESQLTQPETPPSQAEEQLSDSQATPSAHASCLPEQDAGSASLAEEDVILAFGSEPLILRLTTPPPASRSSSEPLKLEVSAGLIACAIKPAHIPLISEVASAVSQIPSSPSQPKPKGSPALALEATTSIKGIVALVLGPQSSLDAHFWSHPLSPSPNLEGGYVKLWVSGISASYSPSEIAASINDLSIFGFERHQDGLLPTPILLTDPSLLDTAAQPNAQVVDWTHTQVRQHNGTKPSMWRGKLAKDASKSFEHAIAVSLDTKKGSQAEISIAPLLVFLDLQYLETCYSILNEIGKRPQFGSQEKRPESDEDDEETKERKRLEKLVLKDLDLDLDYSPPVKATPKKRKRRAAADSSAFEYSVNLDFIRLQVRCPSPPRFVDPRSGALVVDIKATRFSNNIPTDLPRVKFGDSTASPQAKSKSKSKAKLVLAASCSHICISLTPPSPSHPQATLPAHSPLTTHITVSPLSDPEEQSSSLLQPRLEISQLSGRSIIDVRIPIVSVDFDKPSLDGLQYLIDDISQLSERVLNSTLNTPVDSRATSVIGSRYFAPSLKTSTSTAAQSRIDMRQSTRPKENGETVVKLEICETSVRLGVERKKTGAVGPLVVLASDVTGLIEMKPEGRDETVVSVSVMDLSLRDFASPQAPLTVFNLRSPRSIGSKCLPIVKLSFTSLTIPHTLTKESRVNVGLCGALINVYPDFDWVEDVLRCVAAPPGAFESVVPSERTRVRLELSESSLRIFGPTHSGALLLHLGGTVLTTNIVGDAQSSSVDLGISYSELLLVDNVGSLVEADHSVPGSDYWKAAGFASLVKLEDLIVTISQSQAAPRSTTKVQVDRIRLQIHLCADTLGELICFGGDLASIFKKETPEQPKPRRQPILLNPVKVDLMASIEDLAFHNPPEIGPVPDMIYDDLPTNPEYLDESFGAAAGLRELVDEDLDDFQYDDDVNSGTSAAAPGNEGIISKVGGETIKMLKPEGIRIVENHFNVLPPESMDGDKEVEDFKVRVRIQEADFSMHLYEGYDWAKTRKTIEDETREIRRRLARIRQLIASGQTQDPSIETTNTVLFNSVYVGLDEDPDDLSPQDLLIAIDRELREEDDTASQSSWQSFSPGRGVHDTPPQRHGSLPRRRHRLTRGKTPSLEFHLRRTCVAFDQMDADNALASRVLATVENLEILDRMKSSTWRKFLTELRSDSSGNIRETGSSMVRVELKSVRPVSGNATEEARLKAKILPLRLYVDQDALDFLKKFFSFKDPNIPAPPAKDGDADEIYFQHVEVFPVDLKLDYKPRRVDYRALREGKTLELMNFFHFDGAEMTLRHITLNGISGWPRMFDLLNDLWTPDVKATQLVEVISGVAPIRSVVNVGSGVADLVLLPIAQYKKDGRIVRGVQKGTQAFVKSTATEAIKLGARLATGTQVILEQAEDALGGKTRSSITAEAMLSPLTDEHPLPHTIDEMDTFSRYAEQPVDLKQGVQSAYRSLRSNLSSAAQTILAVPMEVYERQGDEGPVRSVIRAVPIAVLKPMIGATEAISQTLLGLHNTLDPNLRYENEAKYKHR